MLIKEHIKTYSISWLAGSYDKELAMGVVENYYIPESIDELKDLCTELYAKKESFRIVGHTSNVYFQSDTNIKHLISTKKLNKWDVKEGYITCECGVNVKSLAWAMVEEEVEGFAGLVDLPGTIGGAIYGNASVSHYSIAGLLESVHMLCDDATIKEIHYEDFDFRQRSSALKRNEMSGVILSCRLRMQKGDGNKIVKEASAIHNWRMKNQPGPSNNLGTTILLGKRSLYGLFLSSLVFLLNIKEVKAKTDFILKRVNASELSPFLFGMNRYLWKNAEAHKLFPKYVRIIKKLYKSPKLEIEIW